MVCARDKYYNSRLIGKWIQTARRVQGWNRIGQKVLLLRPSGEAPLAGARRLEGYHICLPQIPGHRGKTLQGMQRSLDISSLAPKHTENHSSNAYAHQHHCFIPQLPCCVVSRPTVCVLPPSSGVVEHRARTIGLMSRAVDMCTSI